MGSTQKTSGLCCLEIENQHYHHTCPVVVNAQVEIATSRKGARYSSQMVKASTNGSVRGFSLPIRACAKKRSPYICVRRQGKIA